MIQAKKSLGQHFLTNQGIIDKIANQVRIYTRDLKADHVVEIGPGRGALTQSLLENKTELTVLEKDSTLEPVLKQKFSGYSNFRFEAGDVLDFENPVEKLLKSQANSKRFIVCGNLPYNIGAEIVFRFYENHPNVVGFVFMLQKEVVKKFLSEGNDADFGTAAIKMHLGANLGGHFWVQPGSFNPPPKVESGVFWFSRKENPLFEAEPTARGGHYDKIAKFCKKLFTHRRKMLRAIDPSFKNTPWAELRPQQLKIEDFAKIALNTETNHE